MSLDGTLAMVFRSMSRALGFNKLLVDGEGGFWFGYLDSDAWFVLSADRQTIVEVTFPGAFALFDVVNGQAIGVVRDSLDVQRIGVAKIDVMK